MHPSTEQRILRALTMTSTPWWHIAREWGVSSRTVLRIARKHGIRKEPEFWEDLLKGKKRVRAG